ncbi:hypothetical protein MLD38_028103 [Melastoma candidum]|uniref:Uncharacterized protein n=1 Tax=Melastoma candidum TaxID=119954 RepID=A0ACB9MZW6_9MYRT|nr:hypothetical protein MLD38_028103 [Melastoma candidum]
MSNFSGEDGSFSSGNTGEEVIQRHVLVGDHKLQQPQLIQMQQLQGGGHGHHTQVLPTSSNAGAVETASSPQQQVPPKKKRSLPGTPGKAIHPSFYPTAEVVALSPTTLMATNRFVCEICNKGFQRDQNLQLHRRGHNLPWKLRQRTAAEVRKRVYICPEPTCVHHNPARALGDLTGIKKHFSRKHGEKKWKCDKCSKKYAVQSDWKAHQKTCGTREYKCDCGTIFSRRDSFITHRAFCDALAEENNKVNQQQQQQQGLMGGCGGVPSQIPSEIMSSRPLSNPSSNPSALLSDFYDPKNHLGSSAGDLSSMTFKPISIPPSPMFSPATFFKPISSSSPSSSSSPLQLGSQISSGPNTPFGYHLQDSKVSPSSLLAGPGAGSAHMSATALLQKAAQMGATASTGINSPMMHQKTFTTSMAGPEQVSSSTRPPPPPPATAAFGSGSGLLQQQQQQQQHQQQGYDQGYRPQQQEQMSPMTSMNPNGVFGSHMAQLMEGGLSSSQEMFASMFMGGGGDQGSFGMKNMGNHQPHQKDATASSVSSINPSPVPGKGTGSRPLPMFGGNTAPNGTDVMTLDLLGTSGGQSRQGVRGSSNGMQDHNPQRMPQPVMGHGFGQHPNHHLPDAAAMEKTIWDV